jgi:hypothetical protein
MITTVRGVIQGLFVSFFVYVHYFEVWWPEQSDYQGLLRWWSNKTSTLTQNKMTVVTGTFGDDEFDDKNQTGKERRSVAFASDLSAEDKRMIIESVAINPTAFEIVSQ